ncbi:hypothetical protein [Tardiphaga sp.]|uniref:hypothetical protein n=1 Tax=Tardiphaga sp. TaxID=1926292 RepID=UPI002636043D|nr:hypothetical protein [Tardiphaga sp.]MDB5617149.1 hypothetical protein [Tardiphaga sp.]
MKPVSLITFAASVLTLAAIPSLAQNNTQQQPDNHSGTAPENMGATGWTGGSRGQTHDSATSSGPGNSAKDTEAAKDQPEMATGEDLKGPPVQFPANKTPE